MTVKQKATTSIEIIRKEGLITFLKRFIEFIKQVLIGVFATILKKLSIIIPKDEKLVLFGTQPSRLYEDNSRHMYEWILENQCELNPVWMTHHKKVYNELSDRGSPVENIFSLRGIILTLRSSVCVFTHMENSVAIHKNLLPDRVNTIKVAHGDPVKYNPSTSEESQSHLNKRKNIDKIITTSGFIRETRLKRYVHNNDTSTLSKKIKDKFEITGYPRNDLLIDTPEEFRNIWNDYTKHDESQTILLYAPTKHQVVVDDRISPSVQFFPFYDIDDDGLFEFLEENDIVILLRPHPKDVYKMNMCSEANSPGDSSYPNHYVMNEQLKKICSRSDHIRMVTQNEIADTNGILPFVDILITDYSSIYHDYLLLDRPILFIPYDYENFELERGFVYNYLDLLPGPRIESRTQFESEITNILDGDDEYDKKRNELKNMVHKYQDSDSRKRVGELIYRMAVKD